MGRAFVVRQVSMEKTAAAKSKVNSKYGKAIYACAKSGGADPIANLSLQQLIEKAKKDQVPAHVIQKALDKSTGGAGEDYAPARYEGFGPGGMMVIVDCLTDNPKRTFQDVRNAFTKSKSKLGGPGTVAHMFDHHAVFGFSGDDDEVILEALMMADVDVTDVEVEAGKVSVFVPHTEYFKTKTTLIESFEGIQFDVDEITFIPQTDTEISGDDLPLFEKLMTLLDNAEDVQNIYHNAIIVK